MLLSLIGAGITAATSIAGGISSAKKKKESEQMLQDSKNSLEYWYNKEKNEDFLDSSIAKSTLAYLENSNREKEEGMQNNIVRDGSTAEQMVAMAAALNKNYAKSVGDLVAVGEEKEDQINNYYRNQLSAIDNKQYDNVVASSAVASTLGSVGSSIGSGLSAIDSLMPVFSSSDSLSSSSDNLSSAIKINS